MTIDDLELELRKLPGVRSAAFTERNDMLFVQLHVGDAVVDSTVSIQAAQIAQRNADRPVALELVRWRTVEAPTATPIAAAAVPTPAPARVSSPPSVPLDAPTLEAPAFTAATIARNDFAAEAEADVQTDIGSAFEAEFEPEFESELDVELEAELDTDLVEDLDEELDESAIDLVAVATPADTADSRARLLAVLTFPDTDEIEVHLTFDSHRAIGRAEANHGLVAAAEATLDALEQLAPAVALDASWARTLESSTGEGFLVAVEINDEDDETMHGIASGASPVEAAARATLHAANRVFAREVASQ